MATDGGTETEISAPSDTIESSIPATFDTLKSSAADQRTAALVAVNATLPTAVTGLVQLPQLQESTQTGYKLGQAKQVVCCVVGPKLIEKNAAYDFIMMRNVAARDGINLIVNVGFRTMEVQTQLFLERQNPAIAATKGVAAKPGFSNHQTGIALDLETRMTIAMYKNGQFSAEYLWLQAHGADFGFDHAEGAAVNEPWHWTHLPTQIVGTQAFQQITGLSVLTLDTALPAAALNQSGVVRSTYRQGHDATVAVARSMSMTQSSRATLQSEQALFSANLSTGLSSTVSQLEAATLDVEPKAFDTTSLDHYSYDFINGVWGDKNPV